MERSKRGWKASWRKRECVRCRREPVWMSSSWCLVFCVQDALSAEINNLGVNYGKDSSVGATELRNTWSQTFVDREQFLRWEKFKGECQRKRDLEKVFFLAFGGKICDNIMIQKIFWLQDGDFIDAMKGNKLCCVTITISRQEKLIYTTSEINNTSGFIFPPTKDYPGRFSTLNTLWKASYPDLSWLRRNWDYMRTFQGMLCCPRPPPWVLTSKHTPHLSDIKHISVSQQTNRWLQHCECEMFLSRVSRVGQMAAAPPRWTEPERLRSWNQEFPPTPHMTVTCDGCWWSDKPACCPTCS